MTDNKSGPGATLDLHVLTQGSTVSKPNAFVDLILTSSTYTGKLALPTAIGATPTTTDLSSFLTTDGTLKWDPDSLGFTATLTQFYGVDVQSVPEPSGLLLASLALGICGAFVLYSRRRSAAASEKAPTVA
jgi:hypothetical protein